MDDGEQDFQERFREALRSVEQTVFWHAPRRPHDVLRQLAGEAEALALDWDSYGERGAVALLEEQLVALLGAEGALFFPTGVMAQQAALRVWCDRAGSRRVAMPDLSHLLVHEEDGPRRLHGFEVEHLTTGAEVATAASLAAVPGPLGAVLVELPLRDAGCRLPTWEELTGLSEAARARGVRLHVDGARLWEAQPFWDRPLPEVVALADSTYVSFYKGLGGVAGAALVGPRDFLDEARVWRRRMGGTAYRMTLETLSALVGLRDELPRMPELLTWARALASELPDHGIVPDPTVPHTPTFHLHAPGDEAGVNDRVLGFVRERRLQPCGAWRPGREPGRVTTEVVVTTATLGHDPAQVAAWLGQVVHG